MGRYAPGADVVPFRWRSIGRGSLNMFTECSLNVRWMFAECSLNVHWMFTERCTGRGSLRCRTWRARSSSSISTKWHFRLSNSPTATSSHSFRYLTCLPLAPLKPLSHPRYLKFFKPYILKLKIVCSPSVCAPPPQLICSNTPISSSNLHCPPSSVPL
jgi:hypothetical protein